MIDWHSHILPGVDDGSRDIEESLALLRMEMEQGVDTVIATPHFFANDESPDDFIYRRQNGYDGLKQNMPEGAPSILLGAEVRYYPGIGKLSDLKKLCIGDTRLLLLEMPMEKWTDYTVRELVDIEAARHVKLILAHIERYLPMQSVDAWSKLYDSGIRMQVNASYFAGFTTKRKALSSLLEGGIHFIGSDCHNVKYRPPKIGAAYEIIRKKFGDEFVNQMNEYGKSLLKIK